MRTALRRWMPTEAFAEWEARQRGRTVPTGGKTFVAADGVVTALLLPLPDRAMFLGLASHELIECAHLIDQTEAGVAHPEDPRLSNGVVLADEYVTDRARVEIGQPLGWPESVLDKKAGIVEQLDDLEVMLTRPPYEGHPTDSFWMHWVNIARVWAMVAGRADGGATSASSELEAWERHRLTDEPGWGRVRAALAGAVPRARASTCRVRRGRGVSGLGPDRDAGARGLGRIRDCSPDTSPPVRGAARPRGLEARAVKVASRQRAARRRVHGRRP